VGDPSGDNELIRLLDSKIRCVVVASRPVDLRELHQVNSIFVLQLPEGIRTAMGSRGGYGERTIVRAYQFACGGGGCRRTRVVEDDAGLSGLEMPYHAAALPIVQPDGIERLVPGVVDPELAENYANLLEQLTTK